MIVARHLFRRLRRCRRGTSTLEFAFVAPILILSVLGIIELGMILFVTSLLEGSVRSAARFGITGYSPTGISREERVLQILEENTAGLVDMDTVVFTQTVYPSFDSIGSPEPYVDDSPANGAYDAGEEFQDINGNGQWDSDMGVDGVGGPGDVVVYTVRVDWQLLTPMLAPFIGDGGVLPLSASIVVRNEPFESGGTG